MNFDAGETRKPRKLKPEGRRWAGVLAVLAGCFLALHADASDIVLKNGATYAGVTILNRTPKELTIETHFGTMTVQVAEIATIDGVSPAPAVAPRVLSSSPGAPINLRPVPAVLPRAAASVAPIKNAASPAPTEPAATPAGSPSPMRGAESSGQAYTHDMRMDVFILCCGAVVFCWFATMVRVQANLRQDSSKAIGWNVAALLVPVGGFLAFKVYRGIRSMTMSAKERAAKAAMPKGEAIASNVVTEDSHLRFVFENVRPEEPVKESSENASAGLETARHLLQEAVAARTSDVHIEPQESQYRVRFRIDGVLEERAVLERAEGIRVVSALKALGQIDVAEKRKAQDGRFQTRIDNRDVDMRISTATSIFGEKMVIRILDRRGGIFGLAELGMPQEMIEQFNNVIHSRSGMILATGPTGAGKTSTLYAAISQIDRKRLNVMTIEDPVEYKLDGATQLPMNATAGVTYETGLRSILRQDPDVILVGEMRDAEAAKIAMRAALTGTLVFSSLHTKDTLNTIPRLAEMGIEPAQLGSALLMLIAQRLVRVLCPSCREAYESSAEELLGIGIEMPAGETIYRAKGCEECSHTGYLGRTGIFELLILDDEMRQAVVKQIGQDELMELARSKGFIGYRESGAHKILLGITTVQEVLEAG